MAVPTQGKPDFITEQIPNILNFIAFSFMSAKFRYQNPD